MKVPHFSPKPAAAAAAHSAPKAAPHAAAPAVAHAAAPPPKGAGKKLDHHA